MTDDPVAGLPVGLRPGDRVTGVPVAVQGRVGVIELRAEDEPVVGLPVGLRPGDTVTEGVVVPQL